MKYKLALIVIAGGLTAIAAYADEQIDWQVISSGGTVGAASTEFILSGTIGQTAVGSGISGEYSLYQGFWQNLGAGNCCLDWGTPGDANADHDVNLLDILWVIAYKYGTPPGDGSPIGCDELLNADGSGEINLLDILWLISYKYNQPPGAEPLCP